MFAVRSLVYQRSQPANCVGFGKSISDDELRFRSGVNYSFPSLPTAFKKKLMAG